MSERAPWWADDIQESIELWNGSKSFDLATLPSPSALNIKNLSFLGLVSSENNPGLSLLTSFVLFLEDANTKAELMTLVSSDVQVLWNIQHGETCKILGKVGLISPPMSGSWSMKSWTANLRSGGGHRAFSVLSNEDFDWEDMRCKTHAALDERLGMDGASQRVELDKFALMLIEPYKVEWKADSKVRNLSIREIRPDGTWSSSWDTPSSSVPVREGNGNPNANFNPTSTSSLPIMTTPTPRVTSLPATPQTSRSLRIQHRFAASSSRSSNTPRKTARTTIVISDDDDDDILPPPPTPITPAVSGSPKKMSTAGDINTVSKNLFPKLARQPRSEDIEMIDSSDDDDGRKPVYGLANAKRPASPSNKPMSSISAPPPSRRRLSSSPSPSPIPRRLPPRSSASSTSAPKSLSSTRPIPPRHLIRGSPSRSSPRGRLGTPAREHADNASPDSSPSRSAAVYPINSDDSISDMLMAPQVSITGPSAPPASSESPASTDTEPPFPPFDTNTTSASTLNTDIEMISAGSVVCDVSMSARLDKGKGKAPNDSAMATIKPLPPRPKSVSARIWDFMKPTLDPFIIAYDNEIQEMADKHRLGFGVQYELARGVVSKRWTWEQAKIKLREEREVEVDAKGKIVNWYIDEKRTYDRHTRVKKLGIALVEGDNVDVAWRVGELITGRRKRKPNLELWRELDREEKAMKEGKGRALGLMGDWEGYQDWYGGRIQFIFRLHKDKNNSNYTVLLEPLESRRSNYFARALGSKRLAQLRIPDEYLMNDIEGVREFLMKKFVLMGVTYIPFHAKDGNSTYLIDGHALGGLGSYGQVCEWNNPIELNWNQPIAKYSTRNTIGFSNSVPAVEFNEENIIFDLPDQVASEGLELGAEPASHQIMTDGCGFINRSGFRAIVDALPGLKSQALPSAVQGRIAGAKGVWILHPHDVYLDAPPKIWIRPSQNKIILPRPLDRAHRIFNLLATSKPMANCTLSMQSILNLSYNGVPHELLIAKQEEGINMEVRPLMEWKQPGAMPRLWNDIARSGHIGGGRAGRYAAAASRALGLSGRDRAVVELEADVAVMDMATEDLGEEDAVWRGRSIWSGMPSLLPEVIVEMLQSGFDPCSSVFLYQKLRNTLKSLIDKATVDFRVPVLQSTTAIMVPDPIGILEEGEVYFKPSEPIKHPLTYELIHQLEGEVLVGRYPLRIASDIQKVKAVNKPELERYVDVLVLPTKGSRSLASVLSGGDYDGDEDIIIWDRDIVAAFHNHPFVAEPPNFISRYFEKQVERVDDFCTRLESLSEPEAQHAILRVMLLNVCDSKVGLYSNFHDCAVWKYGLNHETSILLAYMFTTILDATKTGLRVKQDIFAEHRKNFGQKEPWLHRPKSERLVGGNFILNDLEDSGKRLKDSLLAEYEHIPTQLDDPPELHRLDRHLLEPYESALQRVNKAPDAFPHLRIELQAIVDHVDKHRLEYPNAFPELTSGTPFTAPKTPGKKGRSGKTSELKAKDRPVSLLAQSYVLNMPKVEFTAKPEEIAASYAYRIGPKFAFTVAFTTLCDIKAHALGIAPCIRVFDEGRVMYNGFIKAISVGEEDE